VRSAECLVLFTKPARPGRVKTRLVGDLTAGQAAELQAAFFEDLRQRLLGGGFTLRVAWALEAGESPPPPRPGCEDVRQEGADLGERLWRALRDAGRAHPRVAAVGSDHPDLPLARVEQAFAGLAAADVVLGPAADGGYYLIALRAGGLRPEIFAGVPWSSERVLEATLERCRACGLRVRLLEPAADVDTPDDLRRLAARVAAGEAECPRTAALLDAWGFLDAAVRR
jgi:rSAM/selenodomain-associated transferase 1